MSTNSLSAPGSILGSRLNEPSTKAIRIFLRDLQDGQAVDAVFLVKDRKLSQKRNGEDFLRLTLSDNTGSRPAVCWDNAQDAHDARRAGQRGAREGAILGVRPLRASAHGQIDNERGA